jgi:hypothetical protein
MLSWFIRIPKKSKIVFPEHKDTSHFNKNLHRFNIGDSLVITEKTEGCVHKDTIIDTLSGRKSIKEIVDSKNPCYIKGKDLLSGEDVYSLCEDFYYVEQDGEWFEIELEDGKKIIITGNNPVYLPNLNIYRRVDELSIGDVCLVEE